MHQKTNLHLVELLKSAGRLHQLTLWMRILLVCRALLTLVINSRDCLSHLPLDQIRSWAKLGFTAPLDEMHFVSTFREAMA